MVKMHQVVKRYKERLALDYLNMEAQEGKVLGLLGPNGAGKTTAIKALIGLIGVDEGDIYVFGERQDGKNKAIKAQIGYVTQEITVYEDMSAKDNLRFFGSLYGLKPDVLESRIQEVAGLIGLSERLHEKVSHFSGGMKRRLNIGCALLHNPRLLIMDEPTVGVDPQSRNYILKFVKDIASKGTSVIYTSHYMEEVQAVADDIYILDAGHVIAHGSLAELIEKVKSDSYLGVTVKFAREEKVHDLLSIPYIKDVTIEKHQYIVNYPAGANVIEEVVKVLSPLGILNINSKQPTLEDVFLTLTGKQLRDGDA